MDRELPAPFDVFQEVKNGALFYLLVKTNIFIMRQILKVSAG